MTTELSPDTLGAPLAAAIRQAVKDEMARTVSTWKPDERLAYSPSEAAGLLGVSRTTVYEMIREHVLPTVMVGPRRMVRRQDILALLERTAES